VSTEDTLKQLLTRAIDEVLSTMMNLSVTHCDNTNDPEFQDNEHITATIGFAGGWNGFVSVACDKKTARYMTSLLLSMDDSNISCEEVRDAVGEIINMIGGRFKALFSEFHKSGKEVFNMSIPSVVEGKAYHVYAPGSSGVTKLVSKIEDAYISALLALSKDYNLQE